MTVTSFKREAMINHWLFKEEPTHYAFSDLQRDQSTQWNGISNALALIYLRQVKKGDQIFYYHTGNEKAIVGIMVALSDAKSGATPKDVSVPVKAVKSLPMPVTLAQIKTDPNLADWELTRISRLSIMPVTAQQWRRVLALAKTASH
jgi:predicted RNA-binding protein with PUA-like domain